MPFKSEKQRRWMWANDPEMAAKWEKKKKAKKKKMKEAKKRDYKAEYKKYGASKKAKKYRAELNKYNRQKGTYGNGDKKDASHRGGKIVGFEEQSKNRGRREKSRLKKEDILKDMIRQQLNTISEDYHDRNEGKMAKRDSIELSDDARDVSQMIQDDTDLPEWVEAKITKAADYMNSVKDYLEHSMKLKKVDEDIGFTPDPDVGKNLYVAPKRDTSGGMKTFYKKFSSPEAKTIIDGSLKKYSKILRKAQYEIIKDWMKAAKAGVIDYFDLIRGFNTGDVRRAHPNEVEFLNSILAKDKIVNRFRSYFGGKKGKKRN